MNIRLLLASSVSLLLLAACGGGTSDDRAVPTQPATNNDGSPATQVVSPVFDASGGNLPFPINLLFAGTRDLTLNPPVANPGDFTNPVAALGTLDGFSTTERWVAQFVDQNRAPEPLLASSVVPGGSVRMFEVAFDPRTLAVLGIVRELTPGTEFVAASSGANLAILPLQPLKQLTTYMAVITNGVQDAAGNNATPDLQYFLAKRQSPLVDANGNSTDPLLDNATARALEPLRQIVNTQEAAAEAFGIPRADIVLSWTATTQSITPVLQVVRALAQPAPTVIAATGLNTSAIGAAGLADIHIGIITLPYYLAAPSAENPLAPLREFWRANPGAYVPPFDQFGLDPTSDFVTVANPIPRVRSQQTVPMLVTVPNANTGLTKPAGGWPVVIFGHGFTRERTDLLAIADALASIGYVGVAIDGVLHGIVPAEDPGLAPFYVENTPFAAVANERHFELDLVNNATGAPGPDGITDPSGTHAINFTSLLTGRDNVRQNIIDLSVVTLSVPNMDIDGDTTPDLDASNIAYAGQSGGSIVGTPFVAVEPLVNRAFFSMISGGIPRTLVNSPTFGPAIRAGLQAAGLVPGTAQYESFLTIAQTVMDPADAINWGSRAVAQNAILVHTVTEDAIFPITVAGSPLVGVEPQTRVMNLTQYNQTVTVPEGLRHRGIFVPPAEHASLFRPTSPAATQEMQSQMASFIASFGTTVVVTNPSLMASPQGE